MKLKIFLTILICTICSISYAASTDGWFGLDAMYIHDSCGDDGTETLEQAADCSSAWWDHSSTAHTHYVVYDLKRSYNVTQWRCRSSTSSDPDEVQFYVSTDGSTWGSALSTAEDCSDSDSWLTKDSTDKVGRYVKFEVTSCEISNLMNWGGISPEGPILDVYVEDMADSVYIPINIMNSSVAQSGASYTDLNYRIPWDGSKYDEIETARFIVSATGTGGTPPDDVDVELYDFTNTTQLAEITGITGYKGSFDRQNIADDLPSGAALLGIRAKDTGTVRNGVLLLKVRTPVNEEQMDVRLIRDVGWTFPTTPRALLNTTYQEHACKRMYFDADVYDADTIAYSFGSWGKALGTATLYMELWNATSSSQLAENTHTTTSYTYETSTSLSPTDNRDYTQRAKCSGFFCSATPRQSHFIIDMTDATKLEVDWLLGIEQTPSSYFTTNAYVDSSFGIGYIGTDGLQGTTAAFYAEGCAKKNTGTDAGGLQIYEDNVAMTNGSTSYTSTSFARNRNGTALSEPACFSGIEMWGKGYTSSASTLYGSSLRMIQQYTGIDASDPVASAVRRIITTRGM